MENILEIEHDMFMVVFFSVLNFGLIKIRIITETNDFINCENFLL